jgi:putative ABC transport system substrate-binding protein
MLTELGYVEGQNLVVEYRYAEGRAEELRRLAADLVRMQVDVIVANGTPASLMARDTTTTIPGRDGGCRFGSGGAAPRANACAASG